MNFTYQGGDYGHCKQYWHFTTCHLLDFGWNLGASCYWNPPNRFLHSCAYRRYLLTYWAIKKTANKSKKAHNPVYNSSYGLF